MSRRKVFAISATVIVFLVIAFFIGAIYTPYRTVTRYDEFIDSSREQPGIADVSKFEEAPTPTPVDYPSELERMIIYNAYISLETSDIDGILTKIKNLVEIYGGYVVGTSRSTYGVQKRADITVRVPQETFHIAVNEVEGYGKVLDERTTSEDVTEQYIDLTARLENLQKQEKRLHEILDMAKTVKEIIEVERELGRIRGEIERLQGRINYLERSVAMSIITVSLIEPPPPFTPPGMDWGQTFETALTGFFTVVRGLIILIISLVPIGIIGSIVYYVYKRKKQKEKKTE